MPHPHDPGVLDAPMTATEQGANKYCQLLCLLRLVSLKLSKIPHLDFTCYKYIITSPVLR